MSKARKGTDQRLNITCQQYNNKKQQQHTLLGPINAIHSQTIKPVSHIPDTGVTRIFHWGYTVGLGIMEGGSEKGQRASSPLVRGSGTAL